MSEALDDDDLHTLMAAWSEIETGTHASDAAVTLGMLENHDTKRHLEIRRTATKR